MNKQIDFYLKTRTSENHSTNSCLTFSHNKVLKVTNKGLMTSMILIALQKVFNTIAHYIILLKNMSTIGFSKYTIGWFKSFVQSKFRKLLFRTFKYYVQIPYWSIVGPLPFLIYVNDIPQAVKSNLFLYADDCCLVFQGKDVIKIETRLNGDFTNTCEWFVHTRLSIHFGEDKIKPVLFASKGKTKKYPKLNITFKNIQIKQYLTVTYLYYILDESMSGELITLKVINKINSRLKCKVNTSGIVYSQTK